MRRRVKVGDHWNGIVYKGSNLIIQLIKKGKEQGTALFIGNGHSVTLDDKDNVVRADPGMREFVANISKDDVTIFAFYFKSFVANLLDASVELADFTSEIRNRFDKIIFVGHSKAGLCVESACTFLDQNIDICFAVSTPHAGTISASKEIFPDLLNNSLMKYIYLKTFSNHQVDKDILPNSEVVKRVWRPQNCNQHINVISVLEEKSAWKNIVDLVSLYLDRRVGMRGDAIVSKASQHVPWTDKEFVVYCSHARSLKITLNYISDYILN